MGMLHSSKGAYAFAGLINFCAICIIAFAITDICLNRYQLYNVYGWCTYYPYGWWYAQCYAVANTCWFSQEPYSIMTACSYLYSVGAVALFWQTFILIAACMSHGAAYGCAAVFGFCNFGWWLAAGIYFTNQIKIINDTSFTYQNQTVTLPAGNYRDAVQGVTWAAFAVSVVQMFAIFASFMTRDKREDEQIPGHKLDSEMAPPPQQTYAAQPYPPPGTYQAPPPPPGAYQAPPPAEAGPTGYPAPPK